MKICVLFQSKNSINEEDLQQISLPTNNDVPMTDNIETKNQIENLPSQPLIIQEYNNKKSEVSNE